MSLVVGGEVGICADFEVHVTFEEIFQDCCRHDGAFNVVFVMVRSSLFVLRHFLIRTLSEVEFDETHKLSRMKRGEDVCMM